MGDGDLYRVTLPFESRSGHQLVPPVQLPSVDIVAAATTGYEAEIIVGATSGAEALAQAQLILADVLGTFAVQRSGFAEVHSARRLVQLVDPEPILTGAIPPFDVVGGHVSPHGAELLDPGGALRRARRVVNINAEATVTKANLDVERSWLALRQRWPDDLRRAVALIHASEVVDPDVGFVLSFTALEVLASPPISLFVSAIPGLSDRKKLRESVRTVLASHPGLTATQVDRLYNSLSAAHVESTIVRLASAFTEGGIAISADEMSWIRDQRGAYVHSGGLDNSGAAIERRNAFRSAVSALAAWRLNALADPAGPGASTPELAGD
jgi:hypothetical protein